MAAIINFRYHVVSLVAVFLALGMGVLVGSSFISRGVVAGLEASIRRLDANNRDLIGEVRALREQRGMLEEFVRSSEAWVVQDRLTGLPVVLLATDTTPDDLRDLTAQALVSAGARLDAALQLTPKLDLSSQSRRDAVAAALGIASGDADAMTVAVLDRLVGGLSGRTAGALDGMVAGGLLRATDVAGAPSPSPALAATPASLVVLLGAPPGARSDAGDRLMVPLAEALASRQGSPAVVAVAEPGIGPFQLLGRLREADLRLVTADGVDEPMGRIQLVLGLRAATEGRFGDYGRGPGASSLLPETQK